MYEDFDPSNLFLLTYMPPHYRYIIKISAVFFFCLFCFVFFVVVVVYYDVNENWESVTSLTPPLVCKSIG